MTSASCDCDVVSDECSDVVATCLAGDEDDDVVSDEKRWVVTDDDDDVNDVNGGAVCLLAETLDKLDKLQLAFLQSAITYHDCPQWYLWQVIWN